MQLNSVSSKPVSVSVDPLEAPKDASCFQRMFLAYHRATRNLVERLDRYYSSRCANVLKSVVIYVFSEPFSSIRAGAEFLFYSCQKEPHFSGVNPTKISEKQRRFKPVLCFHGNYHGPQAFTHIAATLQADPDYTPAVFTVKLPNGWFSSKDDQIIDEKMAEVEILFGETQFDVIAHSRGATLARSLKETKKKIDKIVLLGTSTVPSDLSKDPKQDQYYSINGSYDHLIMDKYSREVLTLEVAKDPEHMCIVHAGHVGVLYSCGKQIVKWLKPKST